MLEGETVSYRKGISKKDNRDVNVNYQIDSSNVEPEQGRYL